MSTTTNKAPDPNDFDREPNLDAGGKVFDRPFPPGGSGAGATWAVDARTLRCVKQQESNATGGDEVYIASLALRTTPGRAGSTSVWFHGNLQDITQVRTGTTHAVPNTMGRVTFANVVRRGFDDVAAGRIPELVGTLSVVMESDLTSKKQINNLFKKAAPDVRAVVAGLIEPLTLADIDDEEQLTARFADAAVEIEKAIKPTVIQAIGLGIGSLGDPDDFIEAKVNLFAAVDEVLAPVLDQKLGTAIPPSVGVAGALRPRTYTQRFAGRGAVYDITFHVEG